MHNPHQELLPNIQSQSEHTTSHMLLGVEKSTIFRRKQFFLYEGATRKINSRQRLSEGEEHQETCRNPEEKQLHICHETPRKHLRICTLSREIRIGSSISSRLLKVFVWIVLSFLRLAIFFVWGSRASIPKVCPIYRVSRFLLYILGLHLCLPFRNFKSSRGLEIQDFCQKVFCLQQ